MRTLPRLSLVVLTTVFSTLAVACGDDEPAGPGEIEGAYLLRTIDGQPLPYVEHEDEFFRGEITSGRITLGSGGVCDVSIGFRDTDKETGEASEFASEESCTYSVAGTTLTVTFGPADVETGTISNGTITVDDGEAVWVFRK